MTRFRAVVEYCGTGFAGFQVQPQKRTVQGELERVLHGLCAHPVRLAAAGRTDAGVHALGQVIAFSTDSRRTAEEVLTGGNALLPEDVRLLAVEPVAEEFHPRFDARSRSYRYLILPRKPDPFWASYAWCRPDSLDIPAMQAAADRLLGRRDFAAFCSSPEGESTVRTLHRLQAVPWAASRTPEPLARAGEGLAIEARADAFLRRMVRMLVASLVRVGCGEWPVDELEAVLESGDSARCAPPAPPGGLYLTEVEY